MKRLVLLLCSIWFIAGLQAQPQKHCDSMVYLRNSSTVFGINVFGGAITDFRIGEQGINPFTWKVTAAEMPVNNQQGAPFRGHFLCLGRWGEPTAGEVRMGVPHNGQSGNNCWELSKNTDPLLLQMHSVAPMDGMEATRQVRMDKQVPVVKVTETVQSTIAIARPFNMVQHATIGPPFLDEGTRIDCNAGKGFLQSMSYPDPERLEYTWPRGIQDSARTSLDLTRSDTKFSYVSTHIFSDSLGWVTACNAKQGLLLGYMWRTADYPWINIWQQWRDGALWAKGLEFGTTGIGRSYQDLLATDTRFHGVPSFFLLDAGETVSKSYLCFQARIPKDFAGVGNLKYVNNSIVMQEKDNPTRILTIPTILLIK
jgi:hypothetical protein